MDPFQLQNSFCKRDAYISGPSQSRKSNTSSLSNTLNKNIATALLCDLCGLSYSPLEFMTHA